MNLWVDYGYKFLFQILDVYYLYYLLNQNQA